MKYITPLLVSLLCFSTDSMSSSRDQFDYLALSINKPSYSDLDFSPGLDEDDLSPLKENVEKENVGFRLFYGYQFNRFMAVEGGIDYYGKSDFSLYTEATDGQNVVTKTNVHTGSFSSIGLDVRLVGTYPITNNLYLKASVGALAWDSDHEYVTKEQNNFIANEESESGVSVVTGLSLAYGIRKFAAISLDYEKTEIREIETSNLGISVTFRL